MVEMLVAMAITLIIIGTVVSVLTAFLNDNRTDQFRDDATAHAQMMVDRLSRDIRSGASITAGSSGLLADAGPYDAGFQTVSAKPVSVSSGANTAPSSNATNHVWVRYCLGANNTIWRQSETVATTTANPSFPDATTTVNGLPVDSAGCPSTSNLWIQGAGGSACCVEMNDAVNEIGGDNRPLFTFGPTANPTSVAQIKTIEVDLYVDDNPGHLPGETRLTSGIYLRNELGAPISQPYASKQSVSGGAQITLNGTASTDPNGQALSYQWYTGASCASSSALAGATTQVYNAGDYANGSYTFSLQVTNTAGLTNCNSTAVSVP